jgi:asparaginyl-tRNA synthetase
MYRSQGLQSLNYSRLAFSITTGAVVEITGLWKACPPGKEQSHELEAHAVNVVGASDPEVRFSDLARCTYM